MKTILKRGFYEGERALFASSDLSISESVFENGESPLKESKNIDLDSCLFRWKYPLWYCENVTAKGCTFFDMARAGIWYSKNVELSRCLYEAPKGLRRVEGIKLNDVTFSNAAETLWACDGAELKNVTAKGDYFAMNSKNIKAENLILFGNYGFDGCENVEISSSRLLTKDAFWNCKNIIVKDSFISGEYFGWNSENVTLINCTVESLQGFCYMKNVVLRSCRLINTTLSFEYSSCDAEISGDVDSIKNPLSGRIKADGIKLLIVQPDKVDENATKYECDKIIERTKENVV